MRGVKKILTSKPTLEGAGVRLRRVFGFHEVPELDPFLLLDHFGSKNPADYLKGFPWHPHRGIETVTYMIEGEVRENQCALLDEEGEVVVSSGGAKFLFVAGEPLGEPVAWGGPIVMNTQEELDEAFRELHEGTFIRGKEPEGVNEGFYKG